MINRPPNFASKRRTGWKVFWSFFQSLVALSIILAILSTWYSQAWSTELSAQTTSFLQFRAEDYENQVTHRIPFCQYLNLYGMDLAGAQGLSIAIGGWGMYDLYQWRTKDRADGDLNFGYLDYQFIDGVSLRLGRQFIYERASLVKQVDGLRLQINGLGGFGLSLFGGNVSPPRFDYSHKFGQDDYLAGGRLYYRMLDIGQFGISAAVTTDEGFVSRADLGVDFSLRSYRYFNWAVLEGSALMDAPGKQLAELNTVIHLYPHQNLVLDMGVNHSKIGALLPKTSIFSIFAADNYTKAYLALNYQALTFLNTGLEASQSFFDHGENGYAAGFHSTLYLDPKKQDMLGVKLFRVKEKTNAFWRLRSFCLFNFINTLYTTFELEGLIFDHNLRNQSYSLSSYGSLGARLGPVELAGEIGVSSNPIFERELYGMLKLSLNRQVNYSTASK